MVTKIIKDEVIKGWLSHLKNLVVQGDNDNNN